MRMDFTSAATRSSMTSWATLAGTATLVRQDDAAREMIVRGNARDRSPVPAMAQGLSGKLFGDRGYISQKLFESLRAQGVELITKLRKNMKPKLLALIDKILMRKRALIETVNDQLKNVCQIEHSRHRSWLNALVHLLAGLTAYTWQEKRPALSWTAQEREILNQINPQRKLLLA